MTPLRVAVWGLGRHAVDRIVPAVAAAAGLEVYGVCTRDAARLAAVMDGHRCKGWTASDQMLADPAVDVVYVATPTGLHAAHVASALDAGKHAWCEKPLTTSLESTRRLLDVSRHRGLSIGEGHMYLHHPQFRQFASYLHGGRIGEVRSIACRFGIPRLEFESFRTDPALGGSALGDVGCYTHSAVQALFPDARWRVTCATMTTRSGAAVDTDGFAVLELSNGVVAHLEWMTNVAYRNEIVAWGTTGSVFTDKIFSKPAAHVPVFRLRDRHGAETVETGEAGNHFVAMLEAFRDLAGDAEAQAAERGRIASRAEALEHIRTQARHVAA